LKAKDRSIRGHINRFFKYLKHGSTKVLRNIAGSVFKVVNSLLGSLKEAVAATLPIIGSAIEVIKQIKEHVEAASTGPPTE
jgi:phage-related protein